MNPQPRSSHNRRTFLRTSLAAGTPFALAMLSGCSLIDAQAARPGAGANRTAPAASAPAQSTDGHVLEPTPECVDVGEVTLAQTEGPYFTPNSPERTSLLEADAAGTKLTLTGAVLSTGCQPVAGALVDFWQADDQGRYDNQGYRYRGHQYTDANGHYTLETIVPGLYPGRTRHIHVKVQAPGQRILTTQLYWPNEPRNARDGIYNPKLEMQTQDVADGQAGRFDFVVNAG